MKKKTDRKLFKPRLLPDEGGWSPCPLSDLTERGYKVYGVHIGPFDRDGVEYSGMKDYCIGKEPINALWKEQHVLPGYIVIESDGQQFRLVWLDYGVINVVWVGVKK